MLSAHLAPALIIKVIRPSVNLPLGMVCCMLPDIWHGILVLLRIERLHAGERWSHTLLVVLLMALAVFFAGGLFGASTADASIYAGLVVSHFVLDLVNRQRMSVTPWGGRIPGIGLHERGFSGGYWMGFLVEIFLIIASVSIYAGFVFDGQIRSLFVPALLLAGMLLSEIWYFHIYSSVIEAGLARLSEKIVGENH